WMGDSRGHWEGDTLVADVTYFTDETWLDRAGNFHSDALHVIERYTLADADHIDYEATLEDANVFTKPWTMRMVLYRRKEPNVRVLEYDPGRLIDEANASRREFEEPDMRTSALVLPLESALLAPRVAQHETPKP